MKNSPKIDQLETALKETFNSPVNVAVSSSWQTGLVEQLHELTPVRIYTVDESSRFERNIWKISWISFAASTALAIICMIYVYMQNNQFKEDLHKDLYNSIVMID
jgi:hypothetical protein